MNILQQKDPSTFKLAVNTMEGYYFLFPKDIVRCEGDDVNITGIMFHNVQYGKIYSYAIHFSLSLKVTFTV